MPCLPGTLLMLHPPQSRWKGFTDRRDRPLEMQRAKLIVANHSCNTLNYSMTLCICLLVTTPESFLLFEVSSSSFLANSSDSTGDASLKDACIAWMLILPLIAIVEGAHRRTPLSQAPTTVYIRRAVQLSNSFARIAPCDNIHPPVLLSICPSALQSIWIQYTPIAF